MASISRMTPFFAIWVSSSLTISSKVKPYWKPEQPPPWTNTRSFRFVLPSSSINCFTLAAAASVNTSGSGIVSVDIWVIAFISHSRELHHFLRLRLVLVDEPTLHYRAQLDLERLVVYISCDIALGLQFKVFRGVYRARHRAVDNDVGNADFPIDLRLLRQDQRSGLAFRRDDV